MSKKNSSPLKNPLVVALDVDEIEQALDLAKSLAPWVGGYKLGPRLIIKYGKKIIEDIVHYGPVFCDMKHFDIPSTMLAAVKASFEAGASLVTIHALSGEEALKEVAKLEKELNQIRDFKVLAVTVLTSWDKNSLPKNLLNVDISEHIKIMHKMIRTAGLSGIVCSAQDLQFIDTNNTYICTPGIRFESNDDQKRVMSPKEAISAGANIIVVGRPIVQSNNPVEAVKKFFVQLN